MKGDLHIHTDLSDSSCGIKETLAMARRSAMTHIGITNHDTVNGLSEAVELGKASSIRVIPGIEISSFDFRRNRKVHILGYGFDLEGKNIRMLCDPLLRRRDENSRRQIDILLRNGYDLDLEYINELSRKGGIIYKQHIMMALIKAGYTDCIYSELYRKLFKNDGICAGDIEYVDALDAVRSIKADKGLAVLAHPGQQDSYCLIPELVCAGLDGIEVNHHCHSPEDTVRIRNLREKYGLILTGGTDFHGDYGENRLEIGEIVCPAETLDLINGQLT
jgi:predicted metal-dependent phosphoesterase TrpH